MEKNRKNLLKNNEGFSLVELIIVIAIMAILVAVLAPNLIGNIQKARDAKAKSAASDFKSVVEYTLAEAVAGEMGREGQRLANESYHAFSTAVAMPSDDLSCRLIKRVSEQYMPTHDYHLEAIAMVDDYKVTQIAYKDLDSNRIYVWYSEAPKGLALQTNEYKDKRREWAEFSDTGADWAKRYTGITESIRWNGCGD